jgi:hypothetical protein
LERFLQSIVLLNLVREVGRALIVNSAYYLTSTHVSGDDALVLYRDAGLIPVFFFQCFAAILFRLEIANFDDERYTTAVIVLQGFLEIVLRLTAPQRDAHFKRFLSSLCGTSPAQNTTVLVVPLTVAPKPGREGGNAGASAGAEAAPAGIAASATEQSRKVERVVSERFATTTERDIVVKRFLARLILVDMMAEYIGIYVGTWAMLQGQKNPLAFPMRPFRKNPELLDGATITPAILYVAATQVVIEIVTDAACLSFEVSRGLDIAEAWWQTPKLSLLLPAIAAIWAGSVGGQFRNIFPDDMRACDGRDMCFCVDSGLLPGGMRELYCKLLYPASGGLPPAHGATHSP